MYSEQLSHLLEVNGIDAEVFEQKLHNTLILGVFEAICKDIKKHGNKTEEKVRFMKYSNDKIAATKNIVKRYVGCTLSENEYGKLCLFLFLLGEVCWIADLFLIRRMTREYNYNQINKLLNE